MRVRVLVVFPLVRVPRFDDVVAVVVDGVDAWRGRLRHALAFSRGDGVLVRGDVGGVVVDAGGGLAPAKQGHPVRVRVERGVIGRGGVVVFDVVAVAVPPQDPRWYGGVATGSLPHPGVLPHAADNPAGGVAFSGAAAVPLRLLEALKATTYDVDGVVAHPVPRAVKDGFSGAGEVATVEGSEATRADNVGGLVEQRDNLASLWAAGDVEQRDGAADHVTERRTG